MKKRLFKIAVVCFIFAISFILPQGTAFAAKYPSKSVIIIDDGKTKKITKDSIIAADKIIYIKSGGTLTVPKKVALKIKGRLKIDDGGRLIVRGSVEVEESGTLSCGGKMYIAKGGNVSLDGKMFVSSTGKAYGKGSITVNNKFSDIDCAGEVTAHIQPPEPITKNGVTTVGGVIIVNKNYTLPESYGDGLLNSTYKAYKKMKKASGFDMTIISDFRSYERQGEVFAYWCEIDGYERAINYSALPGRSEHQTGLALDLTSVLSTYAETDEGIWLAEHCYEYGFIIRYPKGKENITGYIYEPWHIRYLGKSMAKMVHDSGLTLEEFLGV